MARPAAAPAAGSWGLQLRGFYRRCRWLEALHLFAHLTFIPPSASVHVAALPREASNLRTLTARDSELRCH